MAFRSVNLGQVVEPFDTLRAHQGLDEHHQQTELGIVQVLHSLRERETKRNKEREGKERRHHKKKQV